MLFVSVVFPVWFVTQHFCFKKRKFNSTCSAVLLKKYMFLYFRNLLKLKNALEIIHVIDYLNKLVREELSDSTVWLHCSREKVVFKKCLSFYTLICLFVVDFVFVLQWKLWLFYPPWYQKLTNSNRYINMLFVATEILEVKCHDMMCNVVFDWYVYHMDLCNGVQYRVWYECHMDLYNGVWLVVTRLVPGPVSKVPVLWCAKDAASGR